jgi:spore coat protein U-like protein
MNKLKKLLFISSALLLSTANNTFAVGPTTGTITASGTVTGTCTVTASNMAFSALGTAGTDTATSTVTPTCTNGTAWVVTNSANTNSLYLGGSVGTSGGTTGTILFPIALTGAGGEAFTQSNAAAGRLTGIGDGSAQNASPTLTGTAASSTGKTAGIYGGTVTLTITY